jgi:putative aldouronate transport system substrate-binding protein
MGLRTRNGTALLCTLAILGSLLAACGGSGGTAANKEKEGDAAKKAPVTLSIILPNQGRIWKNDHPVIKQIEERTNVKLDVNIVADNFENKYNLLAASGDIPDINRIGAFAYQQYVDSGLFLELDQLIEKYGKNLKKQIPAEMWGLTRYQGKTYVIPYPNVAGKNVSVVRQDWLDKLGLSVPKTLEEYADMLHKFTYNDPDGNGKQDTYGMGTDANGPVVDFMMIFGAYGVIPGQTYLKDGKLYPAYTSEEYKAALAFLHQLWKDKVMDPEIFILKQDQARQRLVQGKSGSFTGWWSIVPQILMAQMKMGEIQPSAKWNAIFPAVTGPGGKQGMRSSGEVGGSVAISAKSPHPEEAIRFLDAMVTDDIFYLSRYGIEGEHYKVEDGIIRRTPAGTQALEEKWLDPLSQLVNRTEKEKVDQNQDTKYYNFAMEYKLYQDIFYGIPQSDEKKTLGPDVTKYESEMLIKFVTGAESLNNWEQYVAEWKKKGGQKILESMAKKYNEIKGTNYTAGM